MDIWFNELNSWWQKKTRFSGCVREKTDETSFFGWIYSINFYYKKSREKIFSYSHWSFEWKNFDLLEAPVELQALPKKINLHKCADVLPSCEQISYEAITWRELVGKSNFMTYMRRVLQSKYLFCGWNKSSQFIDHMRTY